MEVRVLFFWARRPSRGPAWHDDVFVRSTTRDRPSLVQGGQAEQAFALMDRNIRRLHHIRSHNMVSAHRVVFRCHLSRATRPVSGSASLRSLRDSRRDSGRQNEQVYLGRHGFRLHFRASPVRVPLATPLFILRQKPLVPHSSIMGILRTDRGHPGTRSPQETKPRSLETFQSETRRHPPGRNRSSPSLLAMDSRIVRPLGSERPLCHKHLSRPRTTDSRCAHVSLCCRVLQLDPVQDLLRSDRSELYQSGSESASPE